MNVMLSKRGDYVVRSAICLGRAYASGEPTKLRQVSSEMGVPRTFVSQILGDLVHAGIAVSSFGAKGGYRLARPPAEVSLLEIVEAGEGNLAADTCVLGEGPCHWERVCPLHESWSALLASVRSELDLTSLADLLERDRAIEEGAYPVPTDAHRLQALTVPVADSVHVELPAPAVAKRLRSGDSWLVPHLEAASAEGESMPLRVGPGGPRWLGKAVAVRLGTSEGDDGELTIGLSWEATGPSGLFPRFEGAFRLVPLDPARSELRLEGRYRPPLGAAGQALDDALLARVARATIRAVLRRVARGLEDAAAQGTERPRAPAGSFSPEKDRRAPAQA